MLYRVTKCYRQLQSVKKVTNSKHKKPYEASLKKIMQCNKMLWTITNHCEVLQNVAKLQRVMLEVLVKSNVCVFYGSPYLCKASKKDSICSNLSSQQVQDASMAFKKCITCSRLWSSTNRHMIYEEIFACFVGVTTEEELQFICGCLVTWPKLKGISE